MNNKFSENLKKIRKEHNLSQEQLADELGVSRQAISKWESSVAYPEMEKIIALCDKFNLNINDLLNKDINETKGEEESKKKINNFINDFLKFVTDTINLFSSMSFKSKIKCILEQGIIILALFVISNILCSIVDYTFYNILYILPNIVESYIKNILSAITSILFLIISVVIWTHIFKMRYLNYYNNYKEEKNNEEESNTEKNTESKKIPLQKESKIIIREPKDSEYRFMNYLFKLIILIIKFFCLWAVMFLSMLLVFLFAAFIVSFLINKTGLFFIGIILMILSSSSVVLIIILLILNFIFYRKNDKKKMIWAFIISIVLFGVGMGISFVGAINFDVLSTNNNMTKQVIKEHDMQEDLIITSYNNLEIEYIESDISNIKIEYTINKFCDLKEEKDISNKNVNEAWSECEKPTKQVKEIIKNINNKKIVPINNNIQKIKLYASSQNIEKLKNNLDNYYKEINSYDERISYYEDKISELEEENQKLNEKINESEEY